MCTKPQPFFWSSKLFKRPHSKGMYAHLAQFMTAVQAISILKNCHIGYAMDSTPTVHAAAAAAASVCVRMGP